MVCKYYDSIFQTFSNQNNGSNLKKFFDVWVNGHLRNIDVNFENNCRLDHAILGRVDVDWSLAFSNAPDTFTAYLWNIDHIWSTLEFTIIYL